MSSLTSEEKSRQIRSIKGSILKMAGSFHRSLPDYTRHCVSVEDLVQEGWLAVCKRRHSYDASRGTTFSTFCYRVVYNHFCNIIADKKRQKRYHYTVAIDSEVGTVWDTPDTSEEDKPRVVDALESFFTLLKGVKSKKQRALITALLFASDPRSFEVDSDRFRCLCQEAGLTFSDVLLLRRKGGFSLTILEKAVALCE